MSSSAVSSSSPSSSRRWKSKSAAAPKEDKKRSRSKHRTGQSKKPRRSAKSEQEEKHEEEENQEESEESEETDEEEESEEEGEEWESEIDPSRKPMQDTFTMLEIKNFLMRLFKLKVGKLETVVNQFKRRRVDKELLRQFCQFCSNRAMLERRVPPRNCSALESKDIDAAEEIYEALASMVDSVPWVARALDPIYLVIDWAAAPPATFTGAGGTLRQAMRAADGGTAVLPLLTGNRAIKLFRAGNYRMLQCRTKTVAGIVVGYIKRNHAGVAVDCYVLETKLTAEHC